MFQVKFKEKVDIENLVLPSKFKTDWYFKHGNYGHKRRTIRANMQHHGKL